MSSLQPCVSLRYYYHGWHTDHDHYILFCIKHLILTHTSSFIVYSSFKGGLYRACPYSYFSVEWRNGCWECCVEPTLWIWRLLALVLWLLFAQCHLVSCHIMHSFQVCLSNRIVVLLLIIQQFYSVLIVAILTCVDLIR